MHIQTPGGQRETTGENANAQESALDETKRQGANETTLKPKKSAPGGTKGQGDNGRQRETTLMHKKSAPDGTKGQGDNGRQRETTLMHKKSAPDGTKGLLQRWLLMIIHGELSGGFKTRPFPTLFYC